jgi:hypothetical protein
VWSFARPEEYHPRSFILLLRGQDVLRRQQSNTFQLSFNHPRIRIERFQERFQEHNNSRKLYFKITNIKPDNISNENICAICLDTLNIQNSVVLNCCHQFCEECINKLLHNHNTLKEPTCPLCRTEITELYFENKHIQNTIINTEYKCISVVDMVDID